MKILNEKVLVRFVPCTVHSTSAMTLAVQTRTTQSSPEQLSWRRWQTGDLYHRAYKFFSFAMIVHTTGHACLLL